MTTMRQSYITMLDFAEDDNVYIRHCLYESKYFEEPCYVVTLVDKDNPDQTDYKIFATFDNGIDSWDYYESLLEDYDLVTF